MMFVLAESLLTEPKKDRRSKQLAAVGNLETASVIV